jgi:hypothetical protein
MMKRIFWIITVLLFTSWLSGCKKFDNYSGPTQTIMGQIIDSSTGQPFQTIDGDMSLEAWELSWGTKTGNVVTPNYWNVLYDGTFSDTKVFTGTYRVYPVNGAFVPLIYTDASGNAVDNGSDTVNVQGGKTTFNFVVSPFLKVEWVGDPVINPDTTLTVTCRISRGTAIPDRIFDVTDVWLFVSTTEYVGNGSFDSKTSTQINYSGTSGDAILGQTISITTKAPLEGDRPYYIRVGARTADNVNRRYNYNAPKQISIP